MGKRLKKVRKAVGKRIKKRVKEARLKYPEGLASLESQYNSLARRLGRIEEFLEPDLSEFHAKRIKQTAVDPLPAHAVGTG